MLPERSVSLANVLLRSSSLLSLEAATLVWRSELTMVRLSSFKRQRFRLWSHENGNLSFTRNKRYYFSLRYTSLFFVLRLLDSEQSLIFLLLSWRSRDTRPSFSSKRGYVTEKHVIIGCKHDIFGSQTFEVWRVFEHVLPKWQKEWTSKTSSRKLIQTC